MRVLAMILAIGACTASAGSAPDTEWKRAWATADCAPWDGAATSVYMSDGPEDSLAAYPFLRISVYHDLSSVAGARWAIGGSGQDGASGVLCAPGSTCASATGGWVEFDGAPAGGPLRGRYQLTMPDGHRLTGSFSAPVRQTAVMCG
jgi:hypothetical protein